MAVGSAGSAAAAQTVVLRQQADVLLVFQHKPGGLPQGIDTMIGESGCRISGGERQRIGIARALYRRPDILFFDEATSALDRNTERSINDSIVRLSEYDKELTIVVIAHRDTSLGYCDRIIEIGK